MPSWCCKNCHWYHEKSGECHAEPPQAQMIPTPRPNMISGKIEMAVDKWTFWPSPKPELVKEIGCGKFKPKLNVAS